MLSYLQSCENGLRLSLHIQPGASKSEFAGIFGNAIKLRIKAKAEDGEANKAVCAFLADFFHVPKTSVSIIRGQSSRTKTVFIAGKSKTLLAVLESAELEKT